MYVWNKCHCFEEEIDCYVILWLSEPVLIVCKSRNGQVREKLYGVKKNLFYRPALHQ